MVMETFKIKVSRSHERLSSREKQERKLAKADEPKLWGKCWSCLKSLPISNGFWCKKKQVVVKEEDSCDDFFGKYKRICVHGYNPHGRR